MATVGARMLGLLGRRGGGPLTAAAARPSAGALRLTGVRTVTTDLPQHVYTKAAGRTLEHLQETMEQYVDSNENDGSDVDFSGDVLTLSLAEGTFVLNKQSPNKQIWLSSPISGPVRYDLDLDRKDWLSTRDGRSLGAMLEHDISALTGKPIAFSIADALETAEVS